VIGPRDVPNGNRTGVTDQENPSVATEFDGLNRAVKVRVLLKRAIGGLYGTDVLRTNLATDYDMANRPLRERQNIGAGAKTVQWSHFADGLPYGVTYPGGTQVSHTYTLRRELQDVKIAGVTQATLSYDLGGRRTGLNRANAVNTVYGYDAADRMTSLDHVGVQGWLYRYTDEGDPLSQVNLTVAARGEAYQYDGMHRVVGHQRGTVLANNTVPAPTFLQGWTLSKVGDWDALNNNGLPEATMDRAGQRYYNHPNRLFSAAATAAGGNDPLDLSFAAARLPMHPAGLVSAPLLMCDRYVRTSSKGRRLSAQEDAFASRRTRHPGRDRVRRRHRRLPPQTPAGRVVHGVGWHRRATSTRFITSPPSTYRR
jgi:hypothetical protein